MLIKLLKISLFVLFLHPVITGFEVTAATEQYKSAKIYTVGIVPQFNSQRISEIWGPILNALEERTGVLLSLRGASAIPAFEKEFSAGDFDFVYMNPYHILLANEGQGYVPLVRDVGRFLHGVLVVRVDSPIKSVKDLDNKTIAFPAPNALGASLLLRADFEDIFKIKVSPRYVSSHSSVYLNVALGKADAGGGVQKTLNLQSSEIRKLLRVIYKTRDSSPHPFAAHPRVPIDVQGIIKAEFLAMGKTKIGKKLLLEIPINKIGEASMEDYKPLAEMGLERFYVGAK